MVNRREMAKIFAFFLLFFVSFSSLPGQSSIYRLAPGTKIRVQMDNEINSEVSSVDDTFTTTVAEPVKIRETVVLPAGTVIEGRITRAERASFGGRGGALALRFETIRFANGETRAIDGRPVNELKAESVRKENLWIIAGGTALGALIGAVAKKGNGALIGAGLGAGVGAGTTVLRKGRQVRIKRDEKFEIELTREVVLPVEDY